MSVYTAVANNLHHGSDEPWSKPLGDGIHTTRRSIKTLRQEDHGSYGS